jgi:hypothetical protein
MRHAIAAALVCASISAMAQDRPHHGAVNPEVTQENIRTTICDGNWSALSRPVRGYTEMIKRRWTTQPWRYELDHIIPLCAGGAPYDEENLQLQPWDEAFNKDEVEVQVCKAICKGTMTLKEGQDKFRQ